MPSRRDRVEKSRDLYWHIWATARRFGRWFTVDDMYRMSSSCSYGQVSSHLLHHWYEGRLEREDKGNEVWYRRRPGVGR